jgi:hypothetical protein
MKTEKWALPSWSPHESFERLGWRRAAIIAAWVIVALPAASVRAELIDRVLAKVGERVVTLSDVRMVQRFGLIDAGASDRVVLDRLIERFLVLEEVERFAPAEPPAADVQQRADVVRGRFASEEEFASALRLSGIEAARIHQWARNDLRIEQYLEQRFAGTVEPTADDIETYLRQHRADLEREAGAADAAALERLVRERVARERRDAVVAEWIDGLRSRARISVNPPL